MTEFTFWLSEHQHWILLVTALLAFCESLALVGIIIPGVALLFATAAAAGSAAIDVKALLAAGFVGAVFGDGVSFMLGRHFHQHITRFPPFSNHPEWITKGEDFFKKYGIASIVIGRFIGPLRPVMPLIAGMLEMPAARFFSINILSAIAWSPFYLLPGYFVGAAAEHQQLLNEKHGLLLVCLIFAPWLISKGVTKLRSHMGNDSKRRRISAIIFFGALGLFVTTYLITNAGLLNTVNAYTLESLSSLRLALLDKIFVAITLLGYWLPMVIWGTAIALALFLQKKIALSIIWISSTLVGQASISFLKNTTALDRPKIVLQPPSSFSFPSGHTAITIVFLGTILLMVRNRLSQQNYQRWILASCIASTLIAFSRLYLGVHWVSDIIAGTALGLMILAFFYGLCQLHPIKHYTQQSASPSKLLLATGVAILCAYAFVIAPSFNESVEHYGLISMKHEP